MPANLTPQYFAAEERYKQAKDDRQKMKALKEMLAIIPKHKGTEKLQADIKRKMARLKDEMDMGLLVITHYQRILNYITPDYVHIMLDGRIVESGGPELALKLEERGYDWIRDKHAALEEA